jgi:ABC-type Fe3+/spermidine/putrescine transport system ATPase subunit
VDEGRFLFSSPDLGVIDVTAAHHETIRANCKAVFMIRPEMTTVSPENGQQILGEIVDRIDLGGHSEYVLQLASGQRWRARVPRSCAMLDPSPVARISIAVESAFVYPS